MMASTTSDDTPHDGAPTSWSTEIDQLAAGVSGVLPEKRLMLISAGNTDNFTFGAGDYLARCDHSDNEIEFPSTGLERHLRLCPHGENGSSCRFRLRTSRAIW